MSAVIAVVNAAATTSVTNSLNNGILASASSLQTALTENGLVVTVESAPTVTDQASAASASDPCFNSLAMVIKADGVPCRIEALNEGDTILAATANGSLTYDTVSIFSIAKPDATASFVSLTMDVGKMINLTAGHHLPVGKVCCSTLKKVCRLHQSPKPSPFYTAPYSCPKPFPNPRPSELSSKPSYIS